ncbi:MAG: flagellar basal body rod protein FlgC [Pseudomonadota bacterium]
MTDFSNSLSVSSSALKAQGQRLRHVAENIANVDTPGYRRKVVSFEMLTHGRDAGSVEVGRVKLGRTDLQEIYDPNHPLADQNGRYFGSNVNLIIEMADAREAQRSYEANLKMFEQAREMSSSLSDLLRR